MNMFEEGGNEYVKQYLKSVSTFSISYLSFREMHQIMQSKFFFFSKNEVLSDDESLSGFPHLVTFLLSCHLVKLLNY